MAFQIRLGKQGAKFSSTHFTVFSATSAERLHGHNYQIEVQVDVPEIDALDFAFDFNALKPLILKLADSLDERVLIAGLNPHLTLKETDAHRAQHLVVQFCNRQYQFPLDEVVVLPIHNVTTEALARYIWQQMADLAKPVFKHAKATRLTVQVTETAGQSSVYIEDLAQ